MKATAYMESFTMRSHTTYNINRKMKEYIRKVRSSRDVNIYDIMFVDVFYSQK